MPFKVIIIRYDKIHQPKNFIVQKMNHAQKNWKRHHYIKCVEIHELINPDKSKVSQIIR